MSGNDAIIGAYGEATYGAQAGAVYIFHFNGLNWVQQTKLYASDAALGDFFGWSVSISGDYAIVGAFRNDDAGDDSGSAYIFYRHQGGPDNWGQQAKLTAIDAFISDNYGWAVWIQGDYAMVGARVADAMGGDSGAAYIYQRNLGGPDNWGQVKKLTASDGAPSDYFGYALCMSGDNAIVGASGDDDLGSRSGSVYIFNQNLGGADNWGEVKKLTPGDGAANDYFGSSVSMSGDDAIVGAYGDDDYSSVGECLLVQRIFFNGIWAGRTTGVNVKNSQLVMARQMTILDF